LATEGYGTLRQSGRGISSLRSGSTRPVGPSALRTSHVERANARVLRVPADAP
jgi:hypothetical protein